MPFVGHAAGRTNVAAALVLDGLASIFTQMSALDHHHLRIAATDASHAWIAVAISQQRSELAPRLTSNSKNRWPLEVESLVDDSPHGFEALSALLTDAVQQKEIGSDRAAFDLATPHGVAARLRGELRAAEE